MTAVVLREHPSFVSVLALRSLIVLFTVATLYVLGDGSVSHAVNAHYHPNGAEGDYGSKYMSWFLWAVFANWLWAMIACWRKEQNFKAIIYSSAALIVIVGGLSAAYKIPRNYHAEISIGQEHYAVPWQFNPLVTTSYEGKAGYYKPKDEGFLVEVSYPEFTGQYVAKDFYDRQLTLSKEEYSDKLKQDIPLDRLCTQDTCDGLKDAGYYAFTDNGAVYGVHYKGRHDVTFRNQDHLDAFKKRIVDLFESFKVPAQG
jgi:hypothetical protein